MSSPVPSSELSTFSISGKQLADAGTQTDGEFAVCDATATPTLNITLPTTSQLSIVRIEESNPQGKTENNRRMSTIIVSSKPGGATLEGGSGDDRSIVSINVPKRFSVSSVSSMKFAEDAGRRDHRGSRTGSIFITHGDSEEILAIDVVPTAGAPDVKDMSTAAKDAHEFKYPDQRSEESVPAPAYEEVVGSHSISEPPVAQDTLNSEPAAVNPKVPEETNVESSVVEVISEGIQTASEISPQDMTLDSPKANEGSLKTNLSSLPKLPPLGTRDFISQVEIAKGIQRQLEDWPVLKAGLLFRKPVPSSSSSRSLHSSSTSLQLRAPERSSARRILGRSLGSLLKGKRKTREVPNFKATFLPEEDEWSLYYAEVRGRYLVFYVLQPMMGQQERGGSGTLVRQSSSLSVGTRDSSSSTRPFSKFLKSFAKKSQASLSSRKVSRDSLERVSYESSRASYDQQRSYLSHLTPEDLKNAPRTLVHYIPLHTATVDAVHSSKPGSTSAYASTSSLTGGSILVLSTLPVEHPEEDTREYLLLDVILHEDLLDVNNELTVSTVNSNVRDAQSTLRQVELSHWMGAIQEASDLSPPMDEPTPGSDKNSSSKSLPDLMQERKMSRESLSPVARTPTDQTSISAKSLHVSPSHGGLASIQESPSASQYAKGVFRKHSRTPTEGSLPSLHQLYSDSLSFRQTARSEVLSSSASVSEHPISGSRELQPPALPKSFAKLFSNKWRNTFDKDAPRARPVISGPTNFTKVEVTPATLLGQAAATGPSSPTSPVSNVQTAEGSDAPPSAEAVVKEEQKRSGWRGLHRKPVEREEIRDRSGKNKEKEGKREPGKRKDSKAGLSPLVISSPIPQPTNSTLPLQQRDNSHPTDTLLSLAQLQQSNAGFSTKPTPQPSVATSKLFFPFFHKNLFAGKEKEIPIVISPAAERLQRSGTVSSRASTMRRRVGRARPESAETMSSDRGTIGSAFRRAEGEVPLTLRKCIELVEEIGLTTEGLYRISGSAATVERLRRLLALDPKRVHLQNQQVSGSPTITSPVLDFVAGAEKPLHRASQLSFTETVSSSRSSLEMKRASGEHRQPARNRRLSTSSIPSGLGGFSGSSLYDNDIHVVTGVIKGFLRQGLGSKKIPLCTFDLYEGFISATQIQDWRTRMIALQDMVHNLPPNHLATLKYLCYHLRRVAAESDKNRMTVRNLSIIFGPTLLRPPPALDNMARIIEDMPFQCTMVETLIEQADWVFGPIEYEEVEEEIFAPGVEASFLECDVQTLDEASGGGVDAGIDDSREGDVADEKDPSDDAKEGEEGDGEADATASVDGSNVDSNVGVVGVDNDHTPTEPTFSDSNETLTYTPTTGGRLKQTPSRLERRRGKVLPATFLDGLQMDHAATTSSRHPHVSNLFDAHCITPTDKPLPSLAAATAAAAESRPVDDTDPQSPPPVPPKEDMPASWTPTEDLKKRVSQAPPLSPPLDSPALTMETESSGTATPPRLSLNLEASRKSFLSQLIQ